MILAVILDSLLAGGIRFVLDKIATAVDSEMNDEGRLREELLSAQMQYESGEITDDELASFEAEVFERLREIRNRERESAGTGSPSPGGISFESGAWDVDVSFDAGRPGSGNAGDVGDDGND